MTFELSYNKMYHSKTYQVTQAEIIEFAMKYDPQYLHLDEEKAKESIFKKIIASGLHTLSMSWKLWIDMDLMKEKVIGGVGMNNVSFLAPVFPGDTLRIQVKITNRKQHERYNDREFFTIAMETYNQDDLHVLKADVIGLMKK